MIPLLVLTALLLVVSGALKLRAAARGEMGLHLPSLLELLAGVALMALTMTQALTVGQGMGASIAAVALVVGSSLHLGRGLSRRRRLRGLTEGRRLQSYVEYLASAPDLPEAPRPRGQRGMPGKRDG